MDADAIPRHPIRVAARRTGLTPATIRAWERRHAAIAPVRSEGGQRLYSDRDLARLDTLRRLTEAGRPIGAVAALSPSEASALLAEDRAVAAASERAPSTADASDGWRELAYDALLRLDDTGLDRTLRRSLATLGAHRFLDGVAVSLLRRVGDGWQSGEVTPVQEHLGSAVLERVLAGVADPSAASEESPRLVVATLPGERHALGARLVAAVAALEGWRVSYLGPDLPPAEIATAARALGADAVAISAVAVEATEAMQRHLRALRAGLERDVELLVGGRAAGALDPAGLPEGIVVLHDLASFRAHLSSVG
jgi:DNA-binding transcriptional MerR regulator/methylmalonyl-CoA mutase cobalamin-binding subunit